ncbi:MAG: BTAD domain-containing putative transcriptional regulator [Caldilineaceae bacterium]
MLKLYLLGRPYVEIEGAEIHLSRRKNRALLAYLALAAEPRRREELTALLWPELDTPHAQTALRRDLWVLRKAVGDDALEVTHDAVGLADAASVWSDVGAFQQLVTAQRAEPQAGEGDGQAHIERLVAIVQLYRNDFMAGFSLRDSPEFDEWQLAQAETLRHDLIMALTALVDAYRQQAQRDLAISYAQRLLEVDPLHEPAHLQLMALYAEEGRYGAALQQYARCAQILAEQVGGLPAPATVSLQREIQAKLNQQISGTRDPERADAAAAQDSKPPASSSHERAALPARFVNLPASPTPFSGRTQELAQIAETMASPQCRLLTVLGPGGMGKTRLATEAARQLQRHYTDGVCFVGLAALRHVDLLPAAILEALGQRREATRSPAETLLAYLQRRHLLLVLDNFEHLRAGLPLIQRLLDDTEKLELLVTTRERLNVAAEWLLPLAGMTYPPSAAIPAPTADITSRQSAPLRTDDQYDAVQFFKECARRIRPNTPLHPSNDAAIIHICQLVEGIPLAIELAAAWLPLMSCTQIAAALRGGIDILATTQSDVDDRHRSMRAALDYSWRMATPAEQLVLARLAVFHGGFTLPLAQAVADADPLMLRTLTDKSWLHRLANGRLVMHELIHQYCAEKLERGAADAPKVLARHARVYGAFMQQRAAELLDHRQVDAVQAVATELDNIRAAWSHATETGVVELLHELLESFYFVGMIRNWHEEMVTLLTQTVAAMRAHVEKLAGANGGAAAKHAFLRARLHARLARYLTDLGLFNEALTHCEASRPLLQSIAQSDHSALAWQPELAFVQALTGHIMVTQGRNDAALENVLRARDLLPAAGFSEASILATLVEAQSRFALGEQPAAIALLVDAAALLRNAGELWLRTRILNDLTFRLRTRNETALVNRYTEERLHLCRTLGDQQGIARCLQDLGFSALFAEKPDTRLAQQYMNEVLGTGDALQNPFLRADALLGLGQIAYFAQQWHAARQYLEQSYAIYFETDGQGDMAISRLWLGEVALEEGQLNAAQRHFAEVLEYAATGQTVAVILLGLEGLAKTRLRQGEIEPALSILAMIARHPNTWEFARGRVRDLLRDLRAELPEAQFAAAIAGGALMTLEEGVDWARQNDKNIITG